MAENKKKEKKEEVSTVADVVQQYTAAIRSIAACAETHITHAHETLTKRIEVLNERLRAVQPSADGKRLIVSAQDMKLIIETQEHIGKPHSEMIAKSLLILGFATFDAYLGTLLRTLYKESPHLINTLEEKTVKVAELLNSKTMWTCPRKVGARKSAVCLTLRSPSHVERASSV